MKIEEMFAFIGTDDGDGVVAAHIGGMMMPLVGADMERIKSLKAVAQSIANQTGKEIKLVKFSVRTDLEVIEPIGK